MAISFPRSLPDVVLAKATFRLQRAININTRRGGAAQISEAADPRWQLSITTGLLEREDYQQARAWWMSLAGGMSDFLAHDPAHPRPIRYRTGWTGITKNSGGDFTGTCTVEDLTATTITLGDLPAEAELVAGDYIGLIEGDTYGLHMVVEDGVAQAGVLSVSVEPKVLTNVFSTSASANLEKPAARFMAVANSDEFEFDLGPLPFAFQAIQRLK